NSAEFSVRDGTQWIERGGGVKKSRRFVRSIQTHEDNARGDENPGVAWVESKCPLNFANCGVPVPVVNRMNESQLGVRHAAGRVELEYALARYPCALEALTGRRVSPFGEVYVDEGERFGRA